MIHVGIIGGAGYTAGELIRILVNHSKININFVFSTSNSGNPISDVHRDLLGVLDLKFTNKINKNIDVLFLCLGHGNSRQFLIEHAFSKTTKIIDLSSDFRLNKNSQIETGVFVYGLPENQKEKIIAAKYIANPGCFATAIQLGILPLAKANFLNSGIHINAVTGATGAGTSLSKTTHFTWRDNNFSHYKAFTHQHLDEIKQTLTQLDASFNNKLYFIPNRGNFSRGIFATTYTTYSGHLEDAKQLYKNYYKYAAFTFISEKPVDIKQVVNTNKCLIHLEKHDDKLLITTVIDNLLKGASGQAVQNMNLMLGFPEQEALQLKASVY